ASDEDAESQESAFPLREHGMLLLSDGDQPIMPCPHIPWNRNLMTKGDATMNSGLILVTGSSGRIGTAVVAELQARGHAVRGFDRVATAGLAEMVIGTLTS